MSYISSISPITCVSQQLIIISFIAFTGALPESIGNWEIVKYVDMSENSFSAESGGLPSTIGNWKMCEWVAIHNAGLGGVLPAEIGQMEALEVLILSQNKKEGVEGSGIEGGIPPEIGGLTRLKQLVLDENRMTGELGVVNLGYVVDT